MTKPKISSGLTRFLKHLNIHCGFSRKKAVQTQTLYVEEVADFAHYTPRDSDCVDQTVEFRRMMEKELKVFLSASDFQMSLIHSYFYGEEVIIQISFSET